MIMPEKITSERITLQAAKNPTFKLAEEIYAAVDKSRENLKKWLPWAETTLSAEDEFMYLSDWCDKHWREGTAFAYLIRKSDNSEFLGVIDIIKVDEKNKTSEIGYWLSSDAEGKGYMSEALKALEPELFKAGINRIEIRNDPQNTHSASVAKRAGYHLDGVLRQDRWSENKQRFHDSNIWSKLSSEQ